MDLLCSLFDFATRLAGGEDHKLARSEKRVQIDLSPSYNSGEIALKIAMCSLGGIGDVFATRERENMSEENLAAVEEEAAQGGIGLLKIVLNTESGAVYPLNAVKGLDHPLIERIVALSNKTRRTIFSLRNQERYESSEQTTLISEFFTAYAPSGMKIDEVEFVCDPGLPEALLSEVIRTARVVDAKSARLDSTFSRFWCEEGQKTLIYDSPRFTKILVESWVAGSEPIACRRLVVSAEDAAGFREIFGLQKCEFGEFAAQITAFDTDQFRILQNLLKNDVSCFVREHTTDSERRLYLVETSKVAGCKSFSGQMHLFFV